MGKKVVKKLSLGVLLFDGFELLDVFGPLEMFGMYPETFDIVIVGQDGSYVASAQGPKVKLDRIFSDDYQYDVLLVPGGRGTRASVSNRPLLSWLETQSSGASWITSVCTGSALLAAAGLLENRKATSNKLAFNWVSSFGDTVSWVKQARWVKDDNIFTSSGVSAGIDMSLALIEEILGSEAAGQAALWAEYEWHRDADWDPFAVYAGLTPLPS